MSAKIDKLRMTGYCEDLILKLFGIDIALEIINQSESSFVPLID